MDSHKTNSVEHIFKEAMRNYHDNNDSRKVYAVCWYAYLNGFAGEESYEYAGDRDSNMYKIRAKSRKEAVEAFLSAKAKQFYFSSPSDLKKACIREIVSSIYKNGKMKCLDNNSVLKDFSYDIEIVIDGEYYSVDETDMVDTEASRTEAIIKNVDYDAVWDVLTPELFVDVYIEAHLYDVAVVELIHFGDKT